MNVAVLPKALVSASAGTHCLRTDLSAKVEVGFTVSIDRHPCGPYLDPEMRSCTLTIEGWDFDLFGDPVELQRQLQSRLGIALEGDMRDQMEADAL